MSALFKQVSEHPKLIKKIISDDAEVELFFNKTCKGKKSLIKFGSNF